MIKSLDHDQGLEIISYPESKFDESSGLSAFPAIVQNILGARGIKNQREIDMSLNDLLPADSLKGLEDALDLLVLALEQQTKILVVGDFDVDGATSTCLALKGLKALGFKNIDFLVPNRFEFGYGLSPEIVELALTRKPELIITVDNGISSIEGVALANENGIKVLVTDHHLPGKQLPAAAAIVNPNQHGCDFPSKNLAGVGVVFYLLIGLRARLRKIDWFVENKIHEPNMGQFLDLVALGTVADVVPLDANNRRLVFQGIERIKSGKGCEGINALLNIAKKDIAKIKSSDLGFALGPRINAAGRLDSMSLGIECLMSANPDQAATLAQTLDDLNQDRKQIEMGIKDEALSILATLNLEGSVDRGDTSVSENKGELPWILCLYEDTWHQGVIGIVASRLKERFHRPCVIFAPDDANPQMIKGSCRSIDGLHIRDLLDRVASENKGLITKFGGHAMAAGLSLEKTSFGKFADALEHCAREMMTEDLLQAKIMVDGEIGAKQLNMQFVETLIALGPWGQKFPEPSFVGVFEIVSQRLVGGNHLKLVLKVLTSNEGLDNKYEQASSLIDAIAFNIDLNVWPNDKREVKIVYSLDINEFRGERNLQLMVDKLFPL